MFSAFISLPLFVNHLFHMKAIFSDRCSLFGDKMAPQIREILKDFSLISCSKSVPFIFRSIYSSTGFLLLNYWLFYVSAHISLFIFTVGKFIYLYIIVLFCFSIIKRVYSNYKVHSITVLH